MGEGLVVKLSIDKQKKLLYTHPDGQWETACPHLSSLDIDLLKQSPYPTLGDFLSVSPLEINNYLKTHSFFRKRYMPLNVYNTADSKWCDADYMTYYILKFLSLKNKWYSSCYIITPLTGSLKIFKIYLVERKIF